MKCSPPTPPRHRKGVSDDKTRALLDDCHAPDCVRARGYDGGRIVSGGHFNYDQYRIGQIADEIDNIIANNNSADMDEYGYPSAFDFKPEVIEKFKEALTVLRESEIYVTRIDYLVSGDDGEDSFLRRLQSELGRG